MQQAISCLLAVSQNNEKHFELVWHFKYKLVRCEVNN